MPATEQPILCLARAGALPAGDGSIQLFPPGVHEVFPSNADPAKKPQALKVTIDEQTAQVLEAKRAQYQAAADAGNGDAPYLDFNHDDREASAWPKKIFWGGDDPLLGGVRAEVEWSAAGDEAIKGKTYRRFSPAFFAAGGKITGAPVNMGGLVNRAAFTTIAPLFAKETPKLESPEPPSTEPTMSEEEIAALKEENAKLKTQLEEQGKQLEELTAAAKAAAEKDAEATVEAAAKEGRIGTGEEIRKAWKAQLIANPGAKELLLALPVNPAFKDVIKAKGAPPEDPAKTADEPKTLAEIIKAKRHPQADA